MVIDYVTLQENSVDHGNRLRYVARIFSRAMVIDYVTLQEYSVDLW